MVNKDKKKHSYSVQTMQQIRTISNLLSTAKIQCRINFIFALRLAFLIESNSCFL
jgi:hypothetical protein